MALIGKVAPKGNQKSYIPEPEPQPMCGSSYDDPRQPSAIDIAMEKLHHMGERIQRINDSHNINNRQIEEVLKSFIGDMPDMTDLNDALNDNRLDVKIVTKGDALDNFINRIYESMTDAEELNYKTNQLISTLKRII